VAKEGVDQGISECLRLRFVKKKRAGAIIECRKKIFEKESNKWRHKSAEKPAGGETHSARDAKRLGGKTGEVRR